jgi:hypothetical protein
MQANGRKATWFNMQQLVVNDYALGILVLKVTTTPQGSYFDRITVLYSAEGVHVAHESRLSLDS